MAIYRKKLDTPNIVGPTTLQDVAGISPISIQSGQSDYSFIATLTVSGLTISDLTQNWQVAFKIMQGSNVLGSYYLGKLNGGFRPSFTFSAIGDVCATGMKEDIHVKWITQGKNIWIREPVSFSILWDSRED